MKCTLCKRSYQPTVVMNTNPLTLIEYFSVMEFKGDRKWCPECAVDEYRRSLK